MKKFKWLYILAVLLIALLLLLIWFWKWTLLFFGTAFYLFSSFASFARVCGIRQKSMFSTFFVFFMIFWAIYIAVAPFEWYILLFQALLLIIPLSFSKNILLSYPLLYCRMLQSDGFDVYYWTVKKSGIKKTEWVKIIGILKAKKYHLSLISLIGHCFYSVIEEKQEFDSGLQEAAFDYWETLAVESVEGTETEIIPSQPDVIYGFIMNKSWMDCWLEHAAKNKSQYRLLEQFFEKANEIFSLYIADPTQLWFETANSDTVEERLNKIIEKIPIEADYENLIIQAETCRGLLMLYVRLAEEMKSLNVPDVETEN